MKLTKEQIINIIKEELGSIMTEDGHEDVSSARRKLKTTIEDASEILQSLESTPEQELPSWWMSKITIVGEYINKARDYLLVSGDTMTEVNIGPGDQAIDMGSQSEQEHNQESAKEVDQMIEMWRQLGIKHGKEIESAELSHMWNKVNLMLGQFAEWLDQGAEALTSGGYDLDEAREGDYKPALDHANKERDVAVFALQKAGMDATKAAQLCFAAHKMLTGEQYLSHAKDDAIADLMKRADLENK